MKMANSYSKLPKSQVSVQGTVYLLPLGMLSWVKVFPFTKCLYSDHFFLIVSLCVTVRKRNLLVAWDYRYFIASSD